MANSNKCHNVDEEYDLIEFFEGKVKGEAKANEKDGEGCKVVVHLESKLVFAGCF